MWTYLSIQFFVFHKHYCKYTSPNIYKTVWRYNFYQNFSKRSPLCAVSYILFHHPACPRWLSAEILRVVYFGKKTRSRRQHNVKEPLNLFGISSEVVFHGFWFQMLSLKHVKRARGPNLCFFLANLLCAPIDFCYSKETEPLTNTTIYESLLLHESLVLRLKHISHWI